MNSDYYTSLSKRVFSVLKRRPLKLCDIIEESQGAYPDDVLTAINSLIKNKQIYIHDDIYLIKNHEYSLIDIKDETKAIPIDLSWITAITEKLSKPHPADYDWRFTSKTIYDIVQLVKDNSSLYNSVALFGTTTLFPIIKKIIPNINLSLFNKSRSSIEDLLNMGFLDDVFVQDLFSKIPYSNKYKLVIADPPWYNDFYEAFITRASEVLEVGGHLFLSVLPVMTRPDAENDIDFIDHCCKKNGFEKIDSLEGFLNYESPIFERRSLINRGIDCYNWRKGDLKIYKKFQDINLNSPISLPGDEPLWEEFIINGIKIKLLKDDDQASQFSFEYSDATSTLSTVSRRSPIRKRINFWTSENLAFKISKLKVLRYLFRFVNSHNSIELALTKVKNDEGLTQEELSSLVDLLKMAHIYI